MQGFRIFYPYLLLFHTFIGNFHLYFIIPDPDFNPKEAKKMEEALRKMEKKEKKTFKGTAKAVGLAAKLSPKAQRKKDLVLNSTAQLKVCLLLHVVPRF